MHLTYAKMLAIVIRENMKLEDNTLNNERLTFVSTKFLPKYWRIVALHCAIFRAVSLLVKTRLFANALCFKAFIFTSWPCTEISKNYRVTQ